MIAKTSRSLNGEGIGCVSTISGGVGGVWQRWKVPATMIVDRDFVSIFQRQMRLDEAGLDLDL